MVGTNTRQVVSAMSESTASTVKSCLGAFASGGVDTSEGDFLIPEKIVTG